MKQFSISALFRWTTLACIVLGVLQRIFRESFNYDRTTAFLMPLYDIVWLLGYEKHIDWYNCPDYMSTLMFLIGFVISVIIHVSALVIVHYLIYGWGNNNDKSNC